MGMAVSYSISSVWWFCGILLHRGVFAQPFRISGGRTSMLTERIMLSAPVSFGNRAVFRKWTPPKKLLLGKENQYFKRHIFIEIFLTI